MNMKNDVSSTALHKRLLTDLISAEWRKLTIEESEEDTKKQYSIQNLSVNLNLLNCNEEISENVEHVPCFSINDCPPLRRSVNSA